MKKLLGSLFVLSFLSCEIFAYKWSAYTDKKTAFIDEPIYLKFICEFEDKASLYTIDFQSKEVENRYILKELKKTQTNKEKRVNTYEFVAFAKSEGLVSFDFFVDMKKTTLESIKEVSGGRDDDVDNESFITKRVKLEPLLVQIQDTHTKKIGSLSMSIVADNQKIQSYEPYHMEIIIKGDANFDIFEPIEFKIKDVDIFYEKPIVKTSLKSKGYHGTWSQKFVFVSKNSFKIPEIKMKYFDLKTRKIRVLFSEEKEIIISKLYEKGELLDKSEEKFYFKYEYLYLLFSFILGLAISKVDFDFLIFKNKNRLNVKIKEIKSLDEICIFLAMKNPTKFKKIIEDISSGKISSLKKAKKEVLKYI